MTGSLKSTRQLRFQKLSHRATEPRHPLLKSLWPGSLIWRPRNLEILHPENLRNDWVSSRMDITFFVWRFSLLFLRQPRSGSRRKERNNREKMYFTGDFCSHVLLETLPEMVLAVLRFDFVMQRDWCKQWEPCLSTVYYIWMIHANSVEVLFMLYQTVYRYI